MSRPDRYADSLAHVDGALLCLNLRLHRELVRWRARHHAEAAPDELAGGAVSAAEADCLLDGLYRAHAPAGADPLDVAPLAALGEMIAKAEAAHRAREAASHAAGIMLTLPGAALGFGLDGFESQVLLLGLAAETDRRYERLFGYLSGDLGYGLPTVDLALALFSPDRRTRFENRRAFRADRGLCREKLIALNPPPGGAPAPLQAQVIALEPAVAGRLLGDQALDAALAGCARVEAGDAAPPYLAGQAGTAFDRLAAHLERDLAGPALVALCCSDRGAARMAAHHLAWRVAPDRPRLQARLDAADRIDLRILRRERIFERAHLILEVAGELEAAPERLSTLLEPPAAGLTVLISRRPLQFASLAGALVCHRLDLPAPGLDGRVATWRAALGDGGDEALARSAAERFRLDAEAVVAAAAAARADTLARGSGRIAPDELFAACRAETAADLGGLAERIACPHGWDDLVLPGGVEARLRGLAGWALNRAMVLERWGFGARLASGRGLAVLFAGPSGTGKTMAAGVLARELGLDLYRIDLSAVVSKYIGETEKNLARIFDAAERANAILFFDEADALFGKRSDVKDAHDRYANIEVSYLLQRMEAYDGVAILATNFKDNLDSAFSRRLHAAIDFPAPEAADRERLWRSFLGPAVPQDQGLDLAFLARQFPLTGGLIRNCALAAAIAAAGEGQAVAMGHLVHAIGRELEKARQPLVQRAFGRYWELLGQHGLRAGRSNGATPP
jgi:hypothetical protein